MTTSTTASSSTSSPTTTGGSADGDLLAALGTRAATVAASVGPAVVSIGRDHRGSGVVIGPDAVLTNAHNLRDRTVAVTFADGRSAQATVRGADPAGDLVVLGVETGDIEPVGWADAQADAGAVVFAIAGSASGPRISFGIVSSTRRSFRGPGGRPITGSVEHTAPLPRGASGGPLLDADGHLVGVNTHRPAGGLYLARGADDGLRRRVEELVAGRSVRPRRLGVALAPPEAARRMRAAVGLDPRDGLLVRGVVDGSPAAAAGLRTGDLLVRADDVELTSLEDLFGLLASVPDGTTVELGVVRGTDELTVAATFPGTAAVDDGDDDDA